MMSIAPCGRLTSLWRVQAIDAFEGADVLQFTGIESLDCSSISISPSADMINFGAVTIIDVHLPDILKGTSLESLWSWFVGQVNEIESAAVPTNAISLSVPIADSIMTGYGALGATEGSISNRVGPMTSAAYSLLVQFSSDATVDEKATALASVGARIVDTVRAGNSDTGDLVLVDANGHATDAIIGALSYAHGVAFVELNLVLEAQATSDDSFFTSGNMWGMYGDKTSPANAFGSQAGEAWAAGNTGKSTIVVGDVDTGLDYTHPDLYLNVWLNQGELPKALALIDYDQDGLITFRDLNQAVNSALVTDLNGNGRIDAGDLLRDSRWSDHIDQDGNGYIDDLIGWDFVNNDNDPYDDNGHGTHTAGTIGAIGGNAVGVAGVNWSIEIMPLKFLDGAGSGTLSNAIKALDYYTVASAADQAMQWTSEFIGTNDSWGGGGYSQSLLDAIVRGAKQDALFIAAAGNGGADGLGDNNNRVANYPSNYSTLNGAGYEAVIAVAAITGTGAIASYSNYGSQTVDLGAPGSNIWSTVPGGYASYSGTSMATPHVTGALALYASLHPDYTASQLRDALLMSTVATASLANKTVTGGRLDISTLAGSGSLPVPSQSLPDLTASNLALNAAGTHVTFQFSNVGMADAINPAASVYLSSDNAITAADTALGSVAVPSLAANASNSESVSVVVPAQATAGTYYLGVIADPAGAIPETNESNNVSNALPVILGTSGADSLNGTSGDDTIFGFGDDDTINGGAGLDTMLGGAGNDTYFVDQQADLVFEAVGGGTDTVISTAAGFYLNANIENLTLAAGSGNNFGVGNTLDNTIIGNEGINTLLGQDGNDTLDGGAGADYLLGGVGDDFYRVDDTFDLVDEGGAFPAYAGSALDFDTISTTAEWFWDVYSVGERMQIEEGAVGSDGAGTTIVGSIFANEMIGNSGTNIMFGRGGADTYRAGDGVDWISLSLLGVTNENAYLGVDAPNTIIVDARTAGAFSYDIIFEFEAGKDKIDVSDYGYATATEVFLRGHDDGFGNSYYALGDGFDYVYLVGLTVGQLSVLDFIV